MNTLPTTVTAAISADTPVIIWGAPGTGKSAAIAALAAEQGAHLETLIGSILDPTDVAGLPIRDAGQVMYAPPPWALRIREALDSGRPAWLFLDELSCSPLSVQAALLRVVLDRTAGDISLRGCRVVAAANRADHAADGGLLAGPLANRFSHVDWQPSAATWAAGELIGWGRPHPPETARWAACITSFIRRNPKALLCPPKSADAQSTAWPSPRSWSASIRVLGADDSPDVTEIVSSCVGTIGAAELTAYLAEMDLPDPEELLAGRAALPERGDRLAAALSAIVAAAAAQHNDRSSRIISAWQIMASIRPDVALSAAQALLGADPQSPGIAIAAELGRRIISVSGGVK